MGSASLLVPSFAKRLEGKVALIAGGASGIGRSAAELFSRHGARVMIADVQDDTGRALCSSLDASYVHCDVTCESDVASAVDAAVSLHGKLDVMFNNAGVFGRPRCGLRASERSDFERVIATNLVGGYLGTKHAARVMVPARRGSIVITESLVATVAHRMAPVAYVCSKHALLGLMRSAALELGEFGVRVNCVSPSVVQTAMAKAAFGLTAEEFDEWVAAEAVLKGARLEAEDVAEEVAYLASDESRCVTGLNLCIDGGKTVA